MFSDVQTFSQQVNVSVQSSILVVLLVAEIPVL